MKQWTDPENIKGLDESIMVMGAFRYAIGRSSYVVGSCIDFLKKYWSTLDEITRKVITRDLYEEIYRDGREMDIGSAKSYILGGDCDRRAWLAFRDWINEHGAEK